MNSMNKEKKNVIKNNIFILKEVFKAIPTLFISYLIFNIIDGFLQFLNNILLIRLVINSIQEGASLYYIILILLLFLSINIVYVLVRNLLITVLIPIGKVKLKKSIQTMMLKKTINIDVAAYDDPQYYDTYILGLYDMENRIFRVMESLGNLLKCLTTITSILTLALLVDPFCIILVTVSVIITTISGKKLNDITFKRKNELLIFDRKSDYTKKLFYLEDYAKEIRLSKISGKVISDYISVIADMKKTIHKYTKSIFSYAYMEDSSTFFFDVVYVFSLTYRAVIQKAISLGDFISMLNAAWSLSNNIESIVRTINEFHEHSIYIQKVRSFVDRENILHDGDKYVNESNNPIQLDHVHFLYPNNEDTIINDVSFKINPNEKIALVGYNGAGKTTLVKLLLRLYDVSKGKVFENNTNIKDYNIKSYREKYGVVFQDFSLYATTLAENVKMDLYEQADCANIIEALEKVKLFNEVPTEDMIMRNITKEFDNEGLLFSGGERQKVALSRIIYSSKNYIILDEPSAALDPESEYRFNELITKELQNKSVIIISHRLSTTRMMDRIFMLENGKIIEQGSHKELMLLGGKYAEMYKIQAKKYGLAFE